MTTQLPINFPVPKEHTIEAKLYDDVVASIKWFESRPELMWIGSRIHDEYYDFIYKALPPFDDSDHTIEHFLTVEDDELVLISRKDETTINRLVITRGDE